jgi:hypothetical protein
MAKLAKKAQVEAPVVEVVEQPAKKGKKAATQEVAPAPAPVVEEKEEVAVSYIDPTAFVYNVKAGKSFTGFSADEVVQFVASMLGKVDKIMITVAGEMDAE